MPFAINGTWQQPFTADLSTIAQDRERRALRIAVVEDGTILTFDFPGSDPARARVSALIWQMRAVDGARPCMRTGPEAGTFTLTLSANDQSVVMQRQGGLEGNTLTYRRCPEPPLS